MCVVKLLDVEIRKTIRMTEVKRAKPKGYLHCSSLLVYRCKSILKLNLLQLLTDKLTATTRILSETDPNMSECQKKKKKRVHKEKKGKLYSAAVALQKYENQ